MRRNKEGSRSPEITDEAKKDVAMPDASKDEDLRAPIVSVNVAAAGPAAALDTSEFVVQRKERMENYTFFGKTQVVFFHCISGGTTLSTDRALCSWCCLIVMTRYV